MQLKYIATTLLAPFTFAAPTPVPNVDNIIGRPAHGLQERQSSSSSSGSSSSIISTVISAALPVVEQMLSSMLPQIESMITSALSGKLSKRSDGSVVYEVQLPQEYAKALKE